MNNDSIVSSSRGSHVELSILSADQVRQFLEVADAFWLYNGEPSGTLPHALLTSGKHSDGYVNVGGAIKEHPAIRQAFARTIVNAMKLRNVEYNSVVGADTSSTLLAEEVARISNARHIVMIKTKGEEGKRQVWSPENTVLRCGDRILHIEELITTRSSALQVRSGIREQFRDISSCCLYFAPFLPTVVERSDPDNRVTRVEDSVILPLLQLNIRNFDPDDCPYCAIGSPAIKPKEGDNWKRLTGR